MLWDDGTLRGVALSPDRKVVVCCGDQFVHLFDAKSGDRLNRLDGHSGAVNCVAFAPNGKLLASAGEDQTIRLWDSKTGKLKGIWHGVTTITFGEAQCLTSTITWSR